MFLDSTFEQFRLENQYDLFKSVREIPSNFVFQITVSSNEAFLIIHGKSQNVSIFITFLCNEQILPVLRR